MAESPTPTPTLTGVSCAGDCNGNARVAIDELIRGVNIALRLAPSGDCSSFDADQNGIVTIDELVRAVAAALGPCA